MKSRKGLGLGRKDEPKEKKIKTVSESKSKKPSGIGQKYVVNLSKPIHNTNFNVTCDNWFYLIPLCEEISG